MEFLLCRTSKTENETHLWLLTANVKKNKIILSMFSASKETAGLERQAQILSPLAVVLPAVSTGPGSEGCKLLGGGGPPGSSPPAEG